MDSEVHFHHQMMSKLHRAGRTGSSEPNSSSAVLKVSAGTRLALILYTAGGVMIIYGDESIREERKRKMTTTFFFDQTVESSSPAVEINKLGCSD